MKLTHYRASKTLYAINWGTFKAAPYHNGAYSITVEAIWSTKKKGALQVCMGSLFSTLYQLDAPPTRESMLSDFDGRYGGNPVARWDGEYLWAPNTPLAAMNAYAERLDPILRALPEVPVGFEGWYDLSS